MKRNLRSCVLLMLLYLCLGAAYGQATRVESTTRRLMVGITIAQVCHIAELGGYDTRLGVRKTNLSVLCTQGVRYAAAVAEHVPMSPEYASNNFSTTIIDF